MSLLGLTHAAVAWTIVRRTFPAQPLAPLLAAGFMLFIPVHIYSAPFLGNEGLAAVLASLAILALLATLARPTALRHALLGLVLGLAMLTKFSTLAVVAGAFLTLALKALRSRRLAAGALHLGVATAVMLAVCGWYYARNVAVYGTPFVMSRSELLVRQVEGVQPQARRSLIEYVLFDPLIFRRPAWPRGFSMTEDLEAGAWRSLRESVWTGIYANAWFDGFGGWVLPPVGESELARRAGQALLCLGLVPTLLVLVGVWTAATRLWREGWDDTLVTMLALLAGMVAIFVHGTRTVPIPAAVKATYFMPIAVVFAFALALGFVRLTNGRPRFARLIVAEGALLALVSVAVFWHGLLFTLTPHEVPLFAGSADNVQGVVYYAAGDRAQARRWFASAAAAGLHLGWENLGLLALEGGRTEEALHLLKRAARLQPWQVFGSPADRAAFNRRTRAEYLNSMAVAYHALGRDAHASRVLTAARARDPKIPEVHYNRGVLHLIDAVRTAPPSAVSVRAAAADLRSAIALA